MNEKNEKRLKEIIHLDISEEDKYTVFKIFLELIMENETEEKEYQLEPPYDVTD